MGAKSRERSLVIPNVRLHSFSAFATCSSAFKLLALRLRNSSWLLSCVVSVSQLVDLDTTNPPATALKIDFFNLVVR